MISRKFEIAINTNSFENKSFITEFLQYDGLNFLNLFLVYINHIPKELIRDDKSLWDKMYICIFNIY